MNPPEREGNRILKPLTAASENIHRLLVHVRQRGVVWVPESIGIDRQRGVHVLSWVDGVVPHQTPEWLFDETVLTEAAVKLRQWHDATVGFLPGSDTWLLETGEPFEVICHNDFAPYNCVFRSRQLVGLIDFDTCAPGSRLWDIAYAAYRFVPLLPERGTGSFSETSPFDRQGMAQRLDQFLKAYGSGEAGLCPDRHTVIRTLSRRLKKLAEWSDRQGRETGQAELQEHARMYRYHAEWVLGVV